MDAKYLPWMRRIHNMETFESDDQMLQWLEEKGAFSQYGHRRKFEDFYISDYCLDHIYDFLTKEEVEHLKVLQAEKIAQLKAADEERGWILIERVHYADNSVDEIWEDKDGNRKTICSVLPHGDVC